MTLNEDDKTPLLAEEGGVRHRSSKKDDDNKEQETLKYKDWDPNLPYGGKVYLARRKKPEPLWIRVTEAVVVIGTLSFALYCYFYFDNVHFHITHGYAKLGYAPAQHQVGQRYLHGAGVEKDHHIAMHWFKKAADQGHPHASYNVAVGHLQGIRTDLLEPGEAHRLIKHAAKNGVKQANQAMEEVCARGGCE
ncbi:hypothetical protein NP493_36g06019 [Ridgeia piscesae]|uniref:Uncharacterized protein n=1 Tax=Ridgeia piscesae TaxID=27915 RepID=A0AAD9PCF6_RIDPI|nr:hypothetical protein NP493_36g06019 [Ridgeia piscesae]